MLVKTGKSKYMFETCDDGFEISAPHRCPARVTVSPMGVIVGYRNDDSLLPRSAHSLVAYRDILHDISAILMKDWCETAHNRWVRQWSLTQTKKSVHSRVKERLDELISKIDRRVLNMHKAVFSATFRGIPYSSLCSSAALDRPYLGRDICNYRAAAVAACMLGKMALTARRKSLVNSESYRTLTAMAAKAGCVVDLSSVRYSLSSDDAVEMMADWRSLYSCDGHTYRSLDRTLMNLPGGVPASLYSELSRFRLTRPLVTRLEMLAATFAATHEKNLVLETVLRGCSPDEIKTALRLINEATGNELSSRSCRSLRFLVLYLGDYPDGHEGKLVGLAKKAIRWHREMCRAETMKTVESLGADTRCTEPPIPLPDEPRIRFIETVGDVCNEGLDMEHCVATYAREAVHGHCYLFHIDHDGTSATVQVDQGGSVVQSCGPRNKLNDAAEWGRRVLRQWGARFPASAGAPTDSISEFPF